MHAFPPSSVRTFAPYPAGNVTIGGAATYTGTGVSLRSADIGTLLQPSFTSSLGGEKYPLTTAGVGEASLEGSDVGSAGLANSEGSFSGSEGSGLFGAGPTSIAMTPTIDLDDINGVGGPGEATAACQPPVTITIIHDTTVTVTSPVMPGYATIASQPTAASQSQIQFLSLASQLAAKPPRQNKPTGHPNFMYQQDGSSNHCTKCSGSGACQHRKCSYQHHCQQYFH